MAYLDAMRIPSFVPQYRLQNAKGSSQCVLPPLKGFASHKPGPSSVTMGAGEHSTQPSSSSGDLHRAIIPPTSHITRPVNVENIVQTLVEPPPHLPSSSSAARIAGVDLKSQPSASPDVAFHFSIWQPCQSLVVIDSYNPTAALPTHALLSNLLYFWSQKTGRAVLPRLDSVMLQWPLVSGGLTFRGLSHAAEMVSTFLNGRLDGISSDVTFWLMGQASYTVLVDSQSADLQASRHGFKRDLFHAKTLEAGLGEAIVLPSLSNMLRRPEIKSRVWHAVASG